MQSLADSEERVNAFFLRLHNGAASLFEEARMTGNTELKKELGALDDIRTSLVMGKTVFSFTLSSFLPR